MAGLLDFVTPFNPNQSLRIGGMSGTDQGGMLGALNNPLLGLAAGLLSGRDPGGTFASGLNQGLVNMQGMQHAALQGGLLKAKLDEIEREKKREEMWAATVGTKGSDPAAYQMSDAELFPGEAQIPGLLNAGTEGTGLYKDDPQMAGLLSILGPDQGRQFMAQAALQSMKPGVDKTANIQNYEFLVSQGVPPEEAMKRVFAQSQGASPFYQALPVMNPDGTPGYAVFDARSGQMSIGQVPGGAVAPAQYSPELQGNIAGAKAGAEVSAKDAAQRTIDLPKVVAEGSYAIKLLDDLERHPGLSMAVGTSSAIPVIPGTKQADFVTRLDQIQGQQFLQAYKTLKGGGQITEVEGKKAEQAMGRLNRAQTEEEFKSSLKELRSVISTGIDRAARGVTINRPQTGATVLRFDANGNQVQ